jgi:SAM-dependent methyltransferase
MKNELLQDVIQWDIKAWGKALSFWDENVDWSKVENCLELGGREGGLSLWLAKKGKNVICSDLNDVKHTAQRLHNKYKVTSFIKYEDLDATNLPYENHFDLIIFKSIIGGIAKNKEIKLQQQVFDEIYKSLKPGGKLLFAENLIGSKLHQKLRKKFTKWSNYWRYISIDEIPTFLHRFSNYKINTTGVIGTFGRNEKQRKLLTKIDELTLNKICPNQWKYIVFGVAEK